ncbi:expressed unknown protein [Seminavis robusta]|uniref:Uncharacterized protein n=1 Tax=Seminavis robusta TaxID=568900 RepID=A0A9N8F2A1_9STRA|nr:expressed unknown protein [Seminavis robusta]|eukprot:Sro2396_g325990.1 n/a (116) ;mRNA; r:6401-6748
MTAVPSMALRSLLLVLLLLLCGHAESAEHPSCTNYTKGEFGPTTVDSQDVCKSACETAEGLPVGDYNMAPNSSCACKSNDAKTDRKLCNDNSAAASTSSLVIMVASSVLLTMALL